jgi:hypothetical protein
MTAHILISGTLWKAPERKTSSRGNEYASASVREVSGTESRWWKITAFNDAALALLALDAGDAVAVQGSFSASAYSKDGEPRVGLSVLADTVTPLKPRKRPRPDKQIGRRADAPPAEEHADPRRLDRHAGHGSDPDLDDVIPF